MPPQSTQNPSSTPSGQPSPRDYRLYFFSELTGRPVCTGNIKNRIGKVSDLVFRVCEPYPEAVGILIDHGWGRTTEFIPRPSVLRIEDDAIFVSTPSQPCPETSKGGGFPPFEIQPGWILLDQHLMGKTILDMDGRRTEVVNDVHLLASQGRMLLIHVDISFNGFLRRWGISRIFGQPDQFINWKYVQPLSVAAAPAGGGKGTVSLSITRKQIREIPPEDLGRVEDSTSREPRTSRGCVG